MVTETGSEMSAWTWGWEALVALGTIALAGVTAFLAFQTRRLASDTQRLAGETKNLAADTKQVAENEALELRAEWQPVLVPAQHDGVPLTYSAEPTIELIARIRNDGRGPALFVRALLQPLGCAPQDWSLGNLGPGDEVGLTFRPQELLESFVGLALDYRDLSGRAYASALDIELGAEPPRYYDVRLFADRSITGLSDAQSRPPLDPL
jgi:hypothetical protein